MLIANETVAEKFYWLEAPFIYRVHPTPDLDKIKELNTFLWNLGYKIKANKDSIHPKAFAEVLEEVKGKPEEAIAEKLQAAGVNAETSMGDAMKIAKQLLNGQADGATLSKVVKQLLGK